MDLRRAIIHAYLYLPYAFNKLSRSGAFGPEGATYLDAPQPDGGNPLKAALARHHVKQFHESSCSVASVVSAINALRDVQALGGEVLTQHQILEAVRTAHWKERMSAGGYQGRRGLPLPVLAEVVASSLEVFALPHHTVETLQAAKNAREARERRRVLRQRLEAFETDGRCLVIAHFDQGAFVPTLNIPHISPVGAFDPATGDVVVLDVDPLQRRPYRVSFDRFYRGLASDYHHIFKPFGYGSGGCVVIHRP